MRLPDGRQDGSRYHLAPSRGNAQRVKAFGGKPKIPPALPDVAATWRDYGVESIAVVFAHAFGSMSRCEGAIDLVIDIVREEDFGADFIAKAPVTTFLERSACSLCSDSESVHVEIMVSS